MAESEIKTEVVTTFSKGTEDVDGFVKKLEAQIDVFDFFSSVIGYGNFNGENPHMSCPFCDGEDESLVFDRKKKTFCCSICGLTGGLVLFLMLYYKISLKTALFFITISFKYVGFSVVPNSFKMFEE